MLTKRLTRCCAITFMTGMAMSLVRAGVYFVRAQAGGDRFVRRVVKVE